MRGIILTWIRINLGIGILTLPFFVQRVGVFYGVVMLFLAAVFTYFCNAFLFEAMHKGKIEDYHSLVAFFLPKWIGHVFKWTLFIDLFSVVIVYMVFSWNQLEFLMFSCHLYKQQWIKDEEKILYYEYSSWVFFIRFAFFTLQFVVLIPFLLKKSLDSLQKITFLYLFVILGLMTFIIVQGLEYRNHYIQNNNWEIKILKEPKTFFATNFFSIIISYYIQPFVLSLKQSLMNPTLKRLKKVAFYSVFGNFLIFLFFSCYCYFCFGDKEMVKIITLRKKLDETSDLFEYFFRFLILCYLIFNSIGVALFNLTFRQYILEKFNFFNKKFMFYFGSLSALLFGCIVALLLPDVIEVFKYFGITIYNFDGFVIPLLLKRKICKMEGGQQYKINCIDFILVLNLVIVVVGLYSFIINTN